MLARDKDTPPATSLVPRSSYQQIICPCDWWSYHIHPWLSGGGEGRCKKKIKYNARHHQTAHECSVLDTRNSIAIKSSNPFGVWLYLFLWPYHYLQAHKGHDHNIFPVSLLKFPIKVGHLQSVSQLPTSYNQERWNYILQNKKYIRCPFSQWPFYSTMLKINK